MPTLENNEKDNRKCLEITEERLLFCSLLGSPQFMSEASDERMCKQAARGTGKESLQ